MSCTPCNISGPRRAKATTWQRRKQCGLSALEATPVSGSSSAPSGYAALLVSSRALNALRPLPANTRQTSRTVGRPTPYNLTKGSSTPSGCPMRHCCSRDGKPKTRCFCRLPDCLGRGSPVPDAAAVALRMSSFDGASYPRKCPLGMDLGFIMQLYSLSYIRCTALSRLYLSHAAHWARCAVSFTTQRALQGLLQTTHMRFDTSAILAAYLTPVRLTDQTLC